MTRRAAAEGILSSRLGFWPGSSSTSSRTRSIFETGCRSVNRSKGFPVLTLGGTEEVEEEAWLYLLLMLQLDTLHHLRG